MKTEKKNVGENSMDELYKFFFSLFLWQIFIDTQWGEEKLSHIDIIQQWKTFYSINFSEMSITKNNNNKVSDSRRSEWLVHWVRIASSWVLMKLLELITEFEKAQSGTSFLSNCCEKNEIMPNCFAQSCENLRVANRSPRALFGYSAVLQNTRANY